VEALTRIIQNLLSRETFFVVGNLFSIASFVLTIFVLLNVRKLRNVYKLKARGPSLIKDLSKSASNLSSFMNEYNAFIPQVTEELGRVAVKLRSLKRKLSGSPKRSVKQVLTYIDRCEVSAQNEEQVRHTYVEIVKVIEELKDNQKDLDWEM
jgi:hypothetical protein